MELSDLRNYTISSEGFMSSSHDLSPTDLVVQLFPVVTGPGFGFVPVCLGCLQQSKDKNTSLKACSTCSWPVCSKPCETSQPHLEECQILKREDVKCSITDFTKLTSELDFFTVFRLLLRIHKDKNVALKINQIKIDIVNLNKINANTFESITSLLKNRLLKDTSTDTIVKAIEYTKLFSMPIGFGAIGLFNDLDKLQHSCCPNTYHVAGGENNNLVLRAATHIKKGDHITMCRVDITKSNIIRNTLLKNSGIGCNCPRCIDASEFDTGFGCLSCSDCKGIISSTGSEDGQDKWKCAGCGREKQGAECRSTFLNFQKQMEMESTNADNNKESVDQYEKMLLRENELQTVPEASQFVFDIWHRLIFIYQYHKDFYFQEESYLKAKINHCISWLKLADVLFPGLSYIKTLIIHEKIAAMSGLLVWMKQNGTPISDSNNFIAKIIKEAAQPIEMLKLEEDQSLCKSIKQMVQMAVEAREEQKQRVLITRWDEEDDNW